MKKILHFFIYLIVGLLSTVFFYAIPFAINTTETGYHIGSTQQIVIAHGVCARFQKTSGSDVFLPTRTQNEFQSFISNPPSNIAIQPCVFGC